MSLFLAKSVTIKGNIFPLNTCNTEVWKGTKFYQKILGFILCIRKI